MDKEEEKTSIKTHEDLVIYQKAFDVAMSIFELSKQFPQEERYSLTDQIRRSSRSVCANMAEAWRKRRYKASFVAKLNDCEAEAAETQVWLKFAVKCDYISTEQGQELYSRYNQILRGEQEWKCLNTVVQNTGMRWSGNVTCFKSNPLNCTLLAIWDQGYKDPWLIVSDLEPEQGNVLWYGLRSWIESSYRDLKSDGWQWHKTRLREPARAERIWLAMAVATLWTVTMGSEKQSHLSETLKEEINPDHKDNMGEKSELKKVSRHISCFLQGLINIVANLIGGKGIYICDLYPQTFLSLNTS